MNMSKNHENFEFFINFFKTVSGAILTAELDKITLKSIWSQFGAHMEKLIFDDFLDFIGFLL